MNLTSKEISKLTDDFFKTSNTENSSIDELVKNIHYCLNKNQINFSVESLLATFNSYKLEFETLTKNKIKVLFYILCGSSETKAKHAFKLIDTENSKKVKSERLKNILKLMGIDEKSISLYPWNFPWIMSK